MSNKNSVFGKLIKFVPNKHKAYFEVDENNIITSYKRKVCIDRAELKARLTGDEIDNLTSMFRYHIQEDKQDNDFVIVNYIMDLREQFGVYIKLQPYNKGTNAKIQLHSMFTNNLSGNSPHILNILNNPKWFITRLDIAFDYTTPFNNSFYVTNGNKKKRNFDTSSWAGSMTNHDRKANESHYDRKAEDNSIDSKFINRFEVKLNFKEADNMTFANLNHKIIVNRLMAEMFIPCLTYTNFHEKAVKTITGQSFYTDLIKQSKKQKHENHIRFMLGTQSRYTTFRENVKACRDDIEQFYLDNSHVIYDFLLSHH